MEESDEPSAKEINRIGKVVDSIESKISEIEDEVGGMEKVSTQERYEHCNSTNLFSSAGVLARGGDNGGM